MSKPFTQQSSSAEKSSCWYYSSGESLSSHKSTQSAETTINETLKQINTTLQGYASHFAQQDKNMNSNNLWTNH